ncbi:MAG: DUF3102 domain-containing protein [Oscillospiraceae bacterium]|nr:DUF3102 domain-containing protein [Oscillospiraceae bacterium]
MNEELQEVRTLEIVAAEIRSYTWSMLANIIEIGRRLTEAKEMLPHGQFMTWCTENFGYSKSQTNNFMRLFEAYGAEQNSLFGAELNRQTFGTLNYSKALALLALPSPEEREAFVEEHDVDSMTTRELQAAIRAKQVAEEQLKAAEQELKAALQDQEGNEKALNDARERIRELAALNEELEKRPVEVAVETVRDEEAIREAAAAAKAEAEKQNERAQEGLKKQLADAEKKLAVAERERDKLKQSAESAGSEAQKKADEANREVDRIRAELEEAKKQLKASDSDVVAFGIWFNNIQSEWNSMMKELRNVEAKDAEKGAKLRAAVQQLMGFMQKDMGDV